MKNLKLILGATLLSVFGFSFSSCNDDDTPPPPPRMIGDVFVRCQLSGTDTVYAPFYSAYANRALKSAEVTSPEAKNIELTSVSSYNDVFRKVPTSEDYVKTIVKNGTYNFKVITQEGDTLQANNKLSDKTYPPVKITKFEYNKENHSFKIEWDELKDMDLVQVTIKDKMDGEKLFTGEYLPPNTTKFEMDKLTPGWEVYDINDGRSCVVIISAYKFEELAQKSWFNVEWQSFATEKIEW